MLTSKVWGTEKDSSLNVIVTLDLWQEFWSNLLSACTVTNYFGPEVFQDLAMNTIKYTAMPKMQLGAKNFPSPETINMLAIKFL